MPDAPELQAHFGQPGNQARGCGFPMAHLLAFFHSAPDCSWRSSRPRFARRTCRHRGILPLLAAGDVLVADRGFCSFASLAMVLVSRDAHAVFRLHQKQIVDFTPGRSHAERVGVGCQGDAAEPVDPGLGDDGPARRYLKPTDARRG